MKIRNGFVSNSSSSSFIVALSHYPQSVEDLKQMLFKDGEIYSYYDESYDTRIIAKRVFDDLKKPKRLSVFGVADELCHGWVKEIENQLEQEGIIYRYNFTKEESRKFFEKREKRVEELAYDMAKKWCDNNNGYFVVCLEYSDNNGDMEAAMEHGGLFDNVPHLVISNH